MSADPNRPKPPPESEADAELARLAAQGRREVLQANAAAASRAAAVADAEGRRNDRSIRLALGSYYGTPLRTASFVLVGVGVLAIPGGFVVGGRLGLDGLGAAGFATGVVVILAGLIGANVLGRVAPRARVDAEAAWVRALPFGLNDYFALLAEESTFACRYKIEVTWGARGMPDPETVGAVLGLWDPGAEVESGDAQTTIVRGAPFKPSTYDDNQARLHLVYPGERVDRVHRLVDKVLLPLHRSHAIARV